MFDFERIKNYEENKKDAFNYEQWDFNFEKQKSRIINVRGKTNEK